MRAAAFGWIDRLAPARSSFFAYLALYVVFKIGERQRFLRKLRIARISPEELMQKLQAGEEVMIVDLRHPRDVESHGAKLPGALHMGPTELDARHQEIPRDRDIVLYCS